MVAAVTIYVPVPALPGARPAPGWGPVRPVDPPARTDGEHGARRGASEVAELARKAHEAARRADAMAGGARLGEDPPERPLMSASVLSPGTDPGRAAADVLYRTVDEFGPGRLGRGFLFDIEV